MIEGFLFGFSHQFPLAFIFVWYLMFTRRMQCEYELWILSVIFLLFIYKCSLCCCALLYSFLGGFVFACRKKVKMIFFFTLGHHIDKTEDDFLIAWLGNYVTMK